MTDTLLSRTRQALEDFTHWLEKFGETSQDHQDFYASQWGRAAKSLYYRRGKIGLAAVAPMVFCEAFAPWTRRFFYPRMRLPIADAHYAMGFAYLRQATGERRYYEKAVHFLDVLRQTRCPGYERHGWGYPFEWQTRNGIIPSGTPLITTTPYCYEAFADVYAIDQKPEWREIMRSTAEHGLRDYKDFDAGPNAATCTYTPSGGQGVVNASSYRAGMLTHAWKEFGDEAYWKAAERNINFVIQSQNSDGSWPYAMDGVRGFIDHFHTCFVMKGLAKVWKLTGHEACQKALQKGVKYYLASLFDERGIPKPFAQAPRMTVYRCELYDCAECLNLVALLQDDFPEMRAVGDRVTTDILDRWRLRSGSFRSRKLLVGWDNVPMHRWGQSEIFRSLALRLPPQPEKITRNQPCAESVE